MVTTPSAEISQLIIFAAFTGSDLRTGSRGLALCPLRLDFFHNRLLKAAWVCIMAGVLGNMTDRLLQGFYLKGAESLTFFENFANGYVVDFLDFSFPWIQTEMFPYGYHWPAFNVADSCVCIAAGLFVIASFFEPKAVKEKLKD